MLRSSGASWLRFRTPDRVAGLPHRPVLQQTPLSCNREGCVATSSRHVATENLDLQQIRWSCNREAQPATSSRQAATGKVMLQQIRPSCNREGQPATSSQQAATENLVLQQIRLCRNKLALFVATQPCLLRCRAYLLQFGPGWGDFFADYGGSSGDGAPAVDLPRPGSTKGKKSSGTR